MPHQVLAELAKREAIKRDEEHEREEAAAAIQVCDLPPSPAVSVCACI